MPPLGHCVYFLVYQNRIIYIGRTHSLAKRLAAHATGYQPKQFDRVLVVACDPTEVCRREREFLARFRPELNHPYEINQAIMRVERTTSDRA